MQRELVFWIFDILQILVIFGARLGQKMQFFWFLAKIWPKEAQKWPKLVKYQKSKKQVLFAFIKASLLQKMSQFGASGEEFYCFEANFQIAGSLYFPIHFAIFREIGPNFETSYLCNGASFFTSVKRFWSSISWILRIWKTIVK